MCDGDPHGDAIPVEHWPTSFLTDEQVDARYRQWVETHDGDRDDTPDPFDW